jgi:hypothetical protein
VMFYATPKGPATGSLDFYHSKPDCSDARYLMIGGGSGFVYFAYVHQGAVFYTKTADPSGSVQVPVLAVEHFEPNDDAMVPGACKPFDAGLWSLGVVTAVSDPALANLTLPLRIK